VDEAVYRIAAARNNQIIPKVLRNKAVANCYSPNSDALFNES